MSGVVTQRRYVRSKLLQARAEGNASEWAWLAKLAAALGSPLVGVAEAVLAKLAAADPPYLYVEDVTGASVDELRERAGLSLREAEAVVAVFGVER